MKRFYNILFAVGIAITMLFPAIVMGQDAIYELPRIVPKKTIVREFKENVAIVYSNDGTDGCFYYVDLTASNCRYAIVPGLDVNDFEIYEKTVYFCGSSPMGNIVGYFDVYGTFFMGTPAQYAIMPTSLQCHVYDPNICYDDILSLKKLEIMDNPGGLPHILLIGEASCTYSVYSVNRCIIDVYYGTSGWSVAMTQEHQSIYYYDDIAVTDNYVVAVGHKHQSSGEYITSFPRPTNPTDNIFSTISMYPPASLQTVFSHGGGSQYILPMDEEFLIEHISGDIFATSCHGGYRDYSGLYMGTVLNIYNTVSNVVNRYYVQDTSIEYRGLKYNGSSNSLYILPGAGISTLPDGYIEYGLDPSFLSLNNVHRHWINTGIDLGSLDAAPQTLSHGFGQSLATSMDTPALYLWRHMSQGECSEIEEIKPVDMWFDNRSFLMEILYTMQGIAFRTYLPNVEIREIDKICGENKSDK